MFVFLIFLFQCIKLILLGEWKKIFSAKSESNDKMMRYYTVGVIYKCKYENLIKHFPKSRVLDN